MRTTQTLSTWTVTLSRAVLQNLCIPYFVKKVSPNMELESHGRVFESWPLVLDLIRKNGLTLLYYIYM